MRKQVVREVFELENTFINNTAQKFKLRSVVQKFNTNKNRWNRIMRQIEEGTYKRDRKKAARRKHQRRKERQEDKKEEVFELNAEEDFIEDLQEIEMEEIFDTPREPTPVANSTPKRPAKDKERIKQQRLAEIQAKLGISNNKQPSPQPAQPRPSKPAQRQNSAQEKKADSSGLSARQKKLQRLKQKLNQEKRQD